MIHRLVNDPAFGNQLSGTIPTELGRMRSALQLMLYDNKLEGTVPAELGDAAKLRYLNAWNNALTGTLPPQLARLTELVELRLSFNALRGTIPPELSSLSSLQVLELSNNVMTGTIPSVLGTLTSLKRLELSNNLISGTIADSLRLNHFQLEKLDLSYNRLSGALPAVWCAPYTAISATAQQRQTQQTSTQGGGGSLNVSIPSDLTQWSMSVFGNAELCGAVPWCMTPAISSKGAEHPLRGTFLVEPASDPTWWPVLARGLPRRQGLCDDTAPQCVNHDDCNITAPPIVTDLTYFEFYFSAFRDAESGIREYEWGLGNTPGADDVVSFRPVSVNASGGGGGVSTSNNSNTTNDSSTSIAQAFSSADSGLALINGAGSSIHTL